MRSAAACFGQELLRRCSVFLAGCLHNAAVHSFIIEISDDGVVRVCVASADNRAGSLPATATRSLPRRTSELFSPKGAGCAFVKAADPPDGCRSVRRRPHERPVVLNKVQCPRCVGIETVLPYVYISICRLETGFLAVDLLGTRVAWSK